MKRVIRDTLSTCLSILSRRLGATSILVISGESEKVSREIETTSREIEGKRYDHLTEEEVLSLPFKEMDKVLDERAIESGGFVFDCNQLSETI
jgi:hypothetical protein